jgi:hypothetical protein
MAATGSKISFAISYGLVGGPLHSQRLRRSLEAANFKPETKTQADIILAHSAGCWLIPDRAKPRLIVYVGMPLANTNPRLTWYKAMTAGLSKNTWQYILKSNLKNAFYFVKQPLRNLKIVHMSATALPIIPNNTRVVFIANQHDPWPQDDRLKEYLATKDWIFLSLPGTHDDLWSHSQRYVEIIEYYARMLK